MPLFKLECDKRSGRVHEPSFDATEGIQSFASDNSLPNNYSLSMCSTSKLRSGLEKVDASLYNYGFLLIISHACVEVDVFRAV